MVRSTIKQSTIGGHGIVEPGREGVFGRQKGCGQRFHTCTLLGNGCILA